MKKITIKDIATEADVSISTVSFVLNGKGEKMNISKAVIKKVHEVAEKLHYKPNMIASSLRTGKTRSIGLIVEDISNQFFSDLARVIEDEAKKLGYRVFYCSTRNDDERSTELIQSLLQANVDGFIITPTEKLEKAILNLIKLKMPVVLIDRYFPDLKVSYVAMDNFEAALTATTYFLNRGHKNIAFVNNTSQMIQMKQREKGYVDAMIKAGYYKQSMVLHLDYHSTEEDKIDKITEFFETNSTVTAVLFAANYMGIAGLQAFRKMRLNIPEKLSIISFDDHYSFKLHSPSISVIEQPIEGIAVKAVELLEKQINGKTDCIVEHILEKGKLLIRESL